MPVHVYVLDGDTLSVLHASASLGTASYRREGTAWKLARPFVWEVRDPQIRDSGPVDLAGEQRAFRAREGWMASTVFLGEPGVCELAVDRSRLERPGVRFAVTYFAGGKGAENLRRWPDGARVLADAAAEHPLLVGAPPDSLALAAEGWRSLSANGPAPPPAPGLR